MAKASTRERPSLVREDREEQAEPAGLAYSDIM